MAIVEVAFFKLNQAMDTREVQDAARGTQIFIEAQPGYLSRTLCEADGAGEWMDVVVWSDLESAEAAQKKAMHSEACAPFFGLIDPQSLRMSHRAVLPTNWEA
jgi:hypothetical protein